MAKGKKKVSSSSESSSESSESSVSEQTSTSTSSSEEETSSSSSSEDRKKSSKKSTKKSTKKDTKSKKSTKESPKKRKKKAKKDKNAPKKATTAYFFYAAKRREDFTKEGSTLKMLEKSKQIGADWKLLSDAEKAPYIKLAEEDKKRAAKEKADYKPPARDSDDSSSSSDEDKPKKKKQKKEKDPNAPKRNMNAYMHYASHQRPILKAKSPTMKPTEMTTALGEQWKSLSEADKKPFEKKAADDKVRYEEAMKKYNSKSKK